MLPLQESTNFGAEIVKFKDFPLALLAPWNTGSFRSSCWTWRDCNINVQTPIPGDHLKTNNIERRSDFWMNLTIIFCNWKIPTIWKVFVATIPSLDITSFVSVLHAWLRQDQVHVYMCHYVPVSQCTGATDKVASQQLRSENTRFTVRVVHSGMGGGSGGAVTWHGLLQQVVR